MSAFSKLFRSSRAATDPIAPAHAAEVRHWNEMARRVNAGERLFWLAHPRVAFHDKEKHKLDGLEWHDWVVAQQGGPSRCALELGCGRGLAIESLVLDGYATSGEGVDLDASRFQARPTRSLQLRAADIDHIELEPRRYDLIYALGSFHHFEALEHIMLQVEAALTDDGYFVLDEFVGPPRFQWTDLQLAITAELLALIPKPLRMYANGVEKAAEGRSTPEEVIRVCPSEAIRSNEIEPLFHRYFDVIHHKKLGGTIQHLLYSGIIQNFPDNIPEVDRMIDSIQSLETRLITAEVLPSDFALLVGKKRK